MMSVVRQVESPDAAVAGPTSAQQRVLIVCSAVVRHGPVTLEDLTQRLPLPQSAIYRALQQLIAQGWVQRSIGRSGFVAAYGIRTMLSHGCFGFPFDRTARALSRRSRDRGVVHFDFALLEAEGTVRIMDSTEAAKAGTLPLTLTKSTAGRAAVCALAPESRVGFLRRYLAQASDSERQASKELKFASLFRFPGDRRFIWSKRRNEFAFAFKAAGNIFGAIRLRAKKPIATRHQSVIETALSCLQIYEDIEDPEFELLLSSAELADVRYTLAADAD